MFFVRLATPYFHGINGLQTHFVHEAADMVAADHNSFVSRERNAQPARAIEGISGIYFVERFHCPYIFGAHRRFVVEAASGNADEFGLVSY